MEEVPFWEHVFVTNYVHFWNTKRSLFSEKKGPFLEVCFWDTVKKFIFGSQKGPFLVKKGPFLRTKVPFW